jgi:hypothetical protein
MRRASISKTRRPNASKDDSGETKANRLAADYRYGCDPVGLPGVTSAAGIIVVSDEIVVVIVAE